MPTLEWIGKNKVINHHLSVPYKVLDRNYSFDKTGKHIEDNGSKNMIIHGDNLLALKSLIPKYEGKVDVIYIDPPYNTGKSTNKNQKWVYNDNVDDPIFKNWLGKVVGDEGEDLTRDDKWLCMMYPRLKLLFSLLKEQGVIFISCDDNEASNLRCICDEIFGKNNFITSIHWRRSESQNNTGHFFAIVGEHILCYIKNKRADAYFDKVPLKASASKEYRYKDEKGYFRRGTIVDATRGNNIFEIEAPNGIKKTIKSIRTIEWLKEQDDLGLIYWTKTGTPYSKIYKDESEGQLCSNWFDEAGVNEDAQDMLTKMGLKFDYSKPKELIETLLMLKNNKNAIILDSFAGSGTTAHAVMELNKDGGNRQFILIEMMDYAESITAERIKKVISGYGEGKNKVDGINGDFSFYELGECLLNEDGSINENTSTDKIREYIYHIETKQELTNDVNNPYLLGKYLNTEYYFYYEKDEITTLNREFLSKLKCSANSYVIYADVCTLSGKELEKYHITFKKIPRDITKI